jgi:hypothetical protein
MQARPVQAVDERGELRSRQPHHAIADRRPAKRSSSRFQYRTSPDPSQAKIFKRSARFERKTKIVPENRSRWSSSRASAARLSAPRRKSTGFVVTSTLTPAGNVITSQPLPHAAPWSASRDRSRRRREPSQRRPQSRSFRSPLSGELAPEPYSASPPLRSRAQKSRRSQRRCVVWRRAVARHGASRTTAAASAHGAERQPRPCPRSHSSRRESAPYAPASTPAVAQIL